MSETTENVETQTQDAAPQTAESKPAETDWKAEAKGIFWLVLAVLGVVQLVKKLR